MMHALYTSLAASTHAHDQLPGGFAQVEQGALVGVGVQVQT
jgi:hypothetical protein